MNTSGIIRLLCILLTLAMLLGVLSACGSGEEEDESASPGSGTEAEETSAVVHDDLPDDLKYDGDEVTILSRWREGWTSGEISVEKTIGEPVNDAVYERNLVVQDRLGVTIVSQEEHDENPYTVVNMVNRSVSAGLCEYDLLASACFVMCEESLNGTFADLRKTMYLDFDKPYWSQGFNEVLEYKDTQYAVMGSLLLSMYRFAFVTTFNKRMFEAANVDYLYDTVKAGKWTLEYQTSLMPLFHRDDGNNAQDKDTDVFGLVTGKDISIDPYWSACDVPILAKDENGDYVLVFESGRLSDVCDRLMTMFYDTDGAVYAFEPYGEDGEQDDIRDMFADGHAAMATLRLMALESGAVRDMADEYGVVPMPKFDEAQKEYKTLLHDQFTVLSIPSTVTGARLDEVSAVMEALCSESYTRVKPAYYETTLRTKIMKDPESAELLDLIIDNVYIDAGIVYTAALSAFHATFRTVMRTTTNTVTSSFKSARLAAEKALKVMAKKLDKLVGA